RSLADREEHSCEPGRHECGAGPVDMSGDAYRGLGHEEVNGDRRDDEWDERQPEEVVEREMVDDRSGEHDACASADAGQRGHDADRARHALSRELVADDSEREREDATRRTLYDATA